ncbi:MAG: polysaccharide biosynthesis/export family protein [Methylomonas sp.]|jgi:polysaccharide export outer membrane protein
MKRLIIGLYSALLLLICEIAYAESGTYQINPGDMLEISVWNEDALHGEMRVLPDGTISFPLVGNITAAGKSVDEVQKIVLDKLTKYLSDPAVTISVKAVDGNTVYVIGQVGKPGNYSMLAPLNVTQVLSLAGGLTTFAKANSILILRREGDTSKAIDFKYGEIETGENLGSNIMMKSGDVVIVP